MILEKGFSTPKSKMVSDVVLCFFRNSKVSLNLLLGKVFSYIFFDFALTAGRHKFINKIVLTAHFLAQMEAKIPEPQNIVFPDTKRRLKEAFLCLRKTHFAVRNCSIQLD
jgi:hypothetical protein